MGGAPLRPDEVVGVARHHLGVRLDPAARERMRTTRQLVDGLAGSEAPVYGVSTGFGSLATQSIPAERRGELPCCAPTRPGWAHRWRRRWCGP